MRTGRKPKCITTVAKLRVELGMTAKQFSDLANRSANTIRRLDRKPENGGLRLSEDLAAYIEKKTGVSVGWLLSGDPSAPITMPSGAIWSRNVFEVIEGQPGAKAIISDPLFGRPAEFRVKRLKGKQREGLKCAETLAHAAKAAARIQGVLSRAFDSTGTSYARALGRLSIFLTEMESAFGSDAVAVQKHGLTIQHLENLALLEIGPIGSIRFVYDNKFYETRKDSPEAPIELEMKAKS